MKLTVLDHLITALSGKGIGYRFKLVSESSPRSWNQWVIIPSKTYLEFQHDGPYRAAEIEWIELDPKQEKEPGRKLSATIQDHSPDIVSIFNQLTVNYAMHDGFFRLTGPFSP